MLKRVAAIDIGTNSTRLLIAEADGRNVSSELYRQSVITRLGQGVQAAGRLAPEAIERTLAVVRDYAHIVRTRQVKEIKAVATSAVRDASNADDLLIPAGESLGAIPETISGESEAAFTYQGVFSDSETAAMGTDFMVIDIGSGSTEIVIGDGNRPFSIKSLQLGCVCLTETFFNSDPPGPDNILALRLHVRERLGQSFSKTIKNGIIGVAVAGTPTSLAAMDLRLVNYDRDKVHRYRLTRDAVADRLSRLSLLPLPARQKIVGLEPDRADVIVSGAAILLEIMIFFGLRSVMVSERDILDGLAISAAI